MNIHTWAYLRVMSHFFYSCVLLIWVNIALGCLKSGEHKCSFLGIICLDLGKGPFDLYFRSRQKCGRKSDKNQRHTRQFWRRTFIARALTNAATVVRRLVESASNFVSNSLTRFSRGSNLRRDSKFACRVSDFNTSDFSCPFMRLRPPEPQFFFFYGSTGGSVFNAISNMRAHVMRSIICSLSIAADDFCHSPSSSCLAKFSISLFSSMFRNNFICCADNFGFKTQRQTILKGLENKSRQPALLSRLQVPLSGNCRIFPKPSEPTDRKMRGPQWRHL